MQLWADLLRSGRNDALSAHFIGSIVYVWRGLSTVTSQEAMLMIDGQQRLTTSTFLIAALANYLEQADIGEPLEGFLARKLRYCCLLNPDEEGERHSKLLLAETDRDTLLAILQPRRGQHAHRRKLPDLPGPDQGARDRTGRRLQGHRC